MAQYTSSRNGNTEYVGGYGHVTLAQAVNIAQNREGGVDQRIAQHLEKKLAQVYARLQAQPNCYILASDEFALVNYYRSRFGDSEIIKSATKRFWDHHQTSRPSKECVVDAAHGDAADTPSHHRMLPSVKGQGLSVPPFDNPSFSAPNHRDSPYIDPLSSLISDSRALRHPGLFAPPESDSKIIPKQSEGEAIRLRQQETADMAIRPHFNQVYRMAYSISNVPKQEETDTLGAGSTINQTYQPVQPNLKPNLTDNIHTCQEPDCEVSTFSPFVGLCEHHEREYSNRQKKSIDQHGPSLKRNHLTIPVRIIKTSTHDDHSESNQALNEDVQKGVNRGSEAPVGGNHRHTNVQFPMGKPDDQSNPKNDQDKSSTHSSENLVEVSADNTEPHSTTSTTPQSPSLADTTIARPFDNSHLLSRHMFLTSISTVLGMVLCRNFGYTGTLLSLPGVCPTMNRGIIQQRFTRLNSIASGAINSHVHAREQNLPQSSDTSNGTTPSEDTSSGKRSSNTILSSSNSESNRTHGKRKRRADCTRRSNNEANSDDDQDDCPRMKGRRSLPDHNRPRKRLKCPYFQRRPEGHLRAACRGEGFADMAKLKDHLKRVHTRPLQCMRCWQNMPSPAERDHHLQKDPICVVMPEPADDRISSQRLQELNFNAGPFGLAKTVEKKWKILFRTLFPAEDQVPSPYEMSGMSMQFEKHFTRILEEELSKELGPALCRIQGRLHQIIQRCKDLTAQASRESYSSCSPPSDQMQTSAEPESTSLEDSANFADWSTVDWQDMFEGPSQRLSYNNSSNVLDQSIWGSFLDLNPPLV